MAASPLGTTWAPMIPPGYNLGTHDYSPHVLLQSANGTILPLGATWGSMTAHCKIYNAPR